VGSGDARVLHRRVPNPLFFALPAPGLHSLGGHRFLVMLPLIGSFRAVWPYLAAIFLTIWAMR
jgi:hypothetical protein